MSKRTIIPDIYIDLSPRRERKKKGRGCLFFCLWVHFEGKYIELSMICLQTCLSRIWVGTIEGY